MISHKHRCIYVHIPKTAGKSIKALFGVPEFGHDYDAEKFHWIEEPYDHHPIRKYEGRDWLRQYLKFAVVRNPWDRLVSAFFYLNRGGSNQGDRAYRDLKLEKYGGNFDAFVHDLPHFMTDKFFRPALYWLEPSAGTGVLVDHVLRYENLVHELDVIAAPLGIPQPKLEILNATEHPHYRDCYSGRAREIVRELYAADIAKFQYQF